MIDMEVICQQAVEHFGSVSRVNLAIEEMSELTKELCKHHRGSINILNIAEEIADVQIMMEQLIILFGIRENVEDWKRTKLLRVKELMSDV